MCKGMGHKLETKGSYNDTLITGINKHRLRRTNRLSGGESVGGENDR